MTNFAHALAPFGADTLVKVTFILTLVALAAASSRRASASFRHLLWALGIGIVFCLPFLSQVLPTWQTAVRLPIAHWRPAAEKTPMAQASAIAPKLAAEGSASLAADIQTALNPRPREHADLTLTRSAPAPATPLWSAGITWMVLLWAAGAVLVLAQLGRGLREVSRLDRESVSIMDGPISDVAAEARAAMEVSRPVILRQALYVGQVAAPLTYGAPRPVIVLPTDAANWPVQRLRAALLHEMAHIRRYDCPILIMTHVVCALYWFHPLVWLAARQVRSESENACDDLVLAAGIPAPDYAHHLLDVALRARRAHVGSAAMAQTPTIESRLRMILALGRRRGEVPRSARAALLAVAACLLVGGSVVRLATRAAATENGYPTASVSDRVRAAASSDPVIMLSNGATVRLLGVKDTQARPDRWWRADGTSVTHGIPKSTLIYPSLPAGIQGRAFAIDTRYSFEAQPKLTWVGRPNFSFDYARSARDPSSYYFLPNFTWQFDPEERLKDLDRIQQSDTVVGQSKSMLVQLPTTFRPDTRTCTVQWAIAAGPWTQTVTCPRKAGKTYIKTPSGDVIFTLIPNPRHLASSRAIAHGSAWFMESDSLGSGPPNRATGSFDRRSDYDRVILALDAKGRVLYDMRGGQMPLVDGRTMSSSIVPNSRLKRVTSFMLLARPFQWAEFKGVALQPGSHGRRSIAGVGSPTLLSVNGP